ncbi:hypothetical protein MM300_14880 [Evansella sp. LMS18]|uniref:phasin family protein n=1 Tax=Evansella sp. LMS18 TaxID=2924033 RepID=UPI0020D17131|nr:hypothetical protein [Evansella sp. LMS18]UTR09179.1 hypothetical protein MM300_14880 [Evansella sp. LMS18]
MSDLLKKGFLLGLGAAVSGKERAEKYLDELLAKGKITPKEADEMYDSFMKKGQETEAKWSSRSKDSVRTMLIDDFELVPRDEFLQLQERVTLLESKLKEQAQTPENNDTNGSDNSSLDSSMNLYTTTESADSGNEEQKSHSTPRTDPEDPHNLSDEKEK